MAVEFFAPVDYFGIGAVGGWEIVTGGSPQKEHSFARQLGSDGDEIAKKKYDTKESISCTYTCTAETGNLTVPKAGEIKNGYHIDTVVITWSQTEYPQMEVSGHKHDTTLGIADSDCRTYTGSLTFEAAGVGIPNEITGAFKLDASLNCGMKGLSYNLEVTHVEEQNCRGAHLAGNNHDGKETLEIELTGNIPLEKLGVDANWDVTSEGINQSNTEATNSSYSLEHHLQHDNPPTE